MSFRQKMYSGKMKYIGYFTSICLTTWNITYRREISLDDVKYHVPMWKKWYSSPVVAMEVSAGPPVSCTHANHSVLATSGWFSHQWVHHRGVHIMRFPHTAANRWGWISVSATEHSHHWQLLQAPDEVWRWPVCKALPLPLLCSQHWNEVACTTDWQDIHQPAPKGYPSHPRRVERHGWKGRRVLQQQSVALCR